MDLPIHPETDDAGKDGAPSTKATSLLTWVVVGAVAALVVAVLVLHLSGVVGPAGN
jgi:hypothetical protein